MKSNVVYSILIMALLLSACTAVSAAANQAVDEPVVDALENTSNGFTLSSSAIANDGVLPIAYTCDGDSATLPLTWSGAPDETVSFAVVMHHTAGADDVHWYWVLYDIPATVSSLAENSSGVGTLGTNSVNGDLAYAPPCSQGPGDKEYTYSVYALSAEPQFSVDASQISRDVLLEAIKDITLASAELNVTFAREEAQQTSQEQNTAHGENQPELHSPDGRTPPDEAIDACANLSEGDACEFTGEKGTETGLCEMVANQLACSPQREEGHGDQPRESGKGEQPLEGAPGQGGHVGYNVEQAISDHAQGMTIAFDAVSFLTGDIGSDSFFPPGKVADFWGFQYLRDNDPSEMGHAGDFLTSAAMNTLYNLTTEQRAELIALADSQVDAINEYGYMRFVLIDAFNRLLEGDFPAGTTQLSEEAVVAYSAELYRLDGEISYDRSELMGSILNNLSVEQTAYFDVMVGKGMLEWPDVEEPADVQSLDRDVKVAVMTYAADMYSWYAGSVEADVYFCPERHGTYFGSFYVKDIHAMSDSTYAIPTDMTGNIGDAMLEMLSPDQSELITSLVDIQRPSLLEIVDAREQISIELRKFLTGGTADRELVLSLMEEYGAYDGVIIYNYATNFVQVDRTLTEEQEAQLMTYREEMLGDLMYPSGAFMYSEPIEMPEIANSDFLFK